MKKYGININRMIIALVVGMIFGIYCAWATSTAPIPKQWLTLEFLIYIWYNRLMLGFVIGFADNFQFIQNKYGNAAIRGAIIGTLLSIILIIIPGWSAISYLFAGIIYGIIIDLIATKFTKSE